MLLANHADEPETTETVVACSGALQEKQAVPFQGFALGADKKHRNAATRRPVRGPEEALLVTWRLW